jgi:hypothetical protein
MPESPATSERSAAPAYAAIWEHVEDLPWWTLVTTGRTGSDAFQSHLDSHPEVFIIPGSITLHRFWQTAASTTYGGPLDATDIADEFIGAFISKLRTKYDTRERMGSLGDGMDQSIDLSPSDFRTHLVGLLSCRPLTPRYFVQAVYVAYALTAGQDVFAKSLFFDHVHHVPRVKDLLATFPGCRVVCMTRDPRAALVSGVASHWKKTPETVSPANPLNILRRIVDEPNALRAMGVDFRVMRLEDIDDENAWRSVCGVIGIAFRPSVMKATWGGLRWWGDQYSAKLAQTMTEQEFTKRIITNRWEVKLTAVDRYVLSYLLSDRLRQCGYDVGITINALSTLLVPFLIVLPTTYELDDLRPRSMWNRLRSWKWRYLASMPYNYGKRLSYYYKLYLRQVRHEFMPLPLFIDDHPVSKDG